MAGSTGCQCRQGRDPEASVDVTKLLTCYFLRLIDSRVPGGSRAARHLRVGSSGRVAGPSLFGIQATPTPRCSARGCPRPPASPCARDLVVEVVELAVHALPEVTLLLVLLCSSRHIRRELSRQITHKNAERNVRVAPRVGRTPQMRNEMLFRADKATMSTTAHNQVCQQRTQRRTYAAPTRKGWNMGREASYATNLPKGSLCHRTTFPAAVILERRRLAGVGSGEVRLLPLMVEEEEAEGGSGALGPQMARGTCGNAYSW